MADIGTVFSKMIARLPRAERAIFTQAITPEVITNMSKVNPNFATSLNELQQSLQKQQVQPAVPTAPVRAAQPAAAPPQAPQGKPLPSGQPSTTTQQRGPAVNTAQNTVQQKTNFADGGVVERGQAPTDPAAPPAAVPEGRADDLKRNMSDGEFVVPEDVVKAKGTEFFDKLIESVRVSKEKRAEEEAAKKQAAQQAQRATPVDVPPAPPGNEQPATTGQLSLPQGTGARRKPVL